MNQYCICPNNVGWHEFQYGNISVATTKVTSDFETWCGQKNRSSNNFEVPESGTYLISAPNGVSFNIWHDFAGAPDKDKGRFEAGKTVELTGKSWKTLGVPSRYYIGNPKGTNKFFEVTFIKRA